MNLNFDLLFITTSKRFQVCQVSGVGAEAPLNAVDLKKDRASRLINFGSLLTFPVHPGSGTLAGSRER